MFRNFRKMIISQTIVCALIGLVLTVGGSPRENAHATTPSSLHKSFNFNDGGDSANSGYANVDASTNISYASDNPSGTTGTTAWETDYSNLSLAYGTRLGGKLVSTLQTDNTSPWCNLKSKFTFAKSIDVVTIRDAQYFGAGGLALITQLYLQSSLDSVTWTNVKQLATPALTISTTAVGDGINIVFNGFTIPANSYLRFGIALTASTVNSGIQFGGITINSYELCV